MKIRVDPEYLHSKLELQHQTIKQEESLGNSTKCLKATLLIAALGLLASCGGDSETTIAAAPATDDSSAVVQAPDTLPVSPDPDTGAESQPDPAPNDAAPDADEPSTVVQLPDPLPVSPDTDTDTDTELQPDLAPDDADLIVNEPIMGPVDAPDQGSDNPEPDLNVDPEQMPDEIEADSGSTPAGVGQDPIAVSSPRVELDGQIYETTSYSGNVKLLGMAKNTGGSSAIFVKVRCDFFDSDSSFVGDGFNYITGSNLHLTSIDTTTNTALKPGEVGVFRVSSYMERSDFSTYECKFAFDNANNTREPEARLEVLGNIRVQEGRFGRTEYLGRVENTGTKGLVFGRIEIVTRDTTDAITDVDSTYINGDNVILESIDTNTDTALDVGATGTFSVRTSVPFDDYGQHTVFISWDDAEISNSVARGQNSFITKSKMRDDYLAAEK